MQKKMVLQVGLLAEASIANRALEGPASVVDVGMSFEITGRRKRLSANIAFMRFVLQGKQKLILSL